MGEFRLSSLADHDLREIYKYGIETWGLAQADRYFDALYAQIAHIADNPTRFPTADHIAPDLRTCVHKSHTVYFRMTNDTVEVVAILRSQNTTRIRQ